MEECCRRKQTEGTSQRGSALKGSFAYQPKLRVLVVMRLGMGGRKRPTLPIHQPDPFNTSFRAACLWHFPVVVTVIRIGSTASY